MDPITIGALGALFGSLMGGKGTDVQTSVQTSSSQVSGISFNPTVTVSSPGAQPAGASLLEGLTAPTTQTQTQAMTDEEKGLTPLLNLPGATPTGTIPTTAAGVSSGPFSNPLLLVAVAVAALIILKRRKR